MLRNVDRFALSRERRIKVGDRVRFPLSLGEGKAYRHPWEIVAFGAGRLAHCVFVRRLADRLERVVSLHWFMKYQELDS